MREAIGTIIGLIILIAIVAFASTIGFLFSVATSVLVVVGTTLVLVAQIIIEFWQWLTRPFRR